MCHTLLDIKMDICCGQIMLEILKNWILLNFTEWLEITLQSSASELCFLFFVLHPSNPTNFKSSKSSTITIRSQHCQHGHLLPLHRLYHWPLVWLVAPTVLKATLRSPTARNDLQRVARQNSSDFQLGTVRIESGPLLGPEMFAVSLGVFQVPSGND